MGYFEHLKSLLEPLGVFSFDAGSLSGAALAAVGSELDLCQGELDTLLQEADLTAAAGEGLARYEAILPWRPVAVTAAERRTALAALLRIGDGGLTRAKMLETLPGCGAEVQVTETDSPQRLEVRFPRLRGVPEDMTRLAEIVEGILPCHLAVDYVYLWLTWAELEAGIVDWDALAARAGAWNEVERMALT